MTLIQITGLSQLMEHGIRAAKWTAWVTDNRLNKMEISYCQHMYDANFPAVFYSPQQVMQADGYVWYEFQGSWLA